MRNSSGFTLLEVMVAMTITALALGSLYGVIAGNKRLAWRAEAALAKAVQVRSHINYAQLTDEQGEVVVDFGKDTLKLANGEKLTEPKRKTWATAADLRSYEIKDEHGDVVASGTYWIRQQLPANANGGQAAGQNAGQFSGAGAQPGAFGGQGQGGGRNGNRPPNGFPQGGGNFPPNGGPQGGNGRFGPNGPFGPNGGVAPNNGNRPVIINGQPVQPGAQR